MNVVNKLARYSAADKWGCLVWQRSTNSRGYGLICFDARVFLAHRVAWETVNGPIAEDMTVDHLCFNKRCINVEHLEIVTRAENSRRGSVNTGKSRCKRGHALIGDNLIVKKRGEGRTPVRNCRTCQQDAALVRRYGKPEARQAAS